METKRPAPFWRMLHCTPMLPCTPILPTPNSMTVEIETFDSQEKTEINIPHLWRVLTPHALAPLSFFLFFLFDRAPLLVRFASWRR